jgi:hypothetical protein
MKIVPILGLVGLIMGMNVSAEDYKTNTILQTCIWKADIAQGAQLAIQQHPGRTPEEHTQKINYLLKDKEDWFRQKVLDVFKEVFETQSIHKSSTKVFVDIYNDCVKKTKADLESGMEYPEIPPEVTEEITF